MVLVTVLAKVDVTVTFDGLMACRGATAAWLSSANAKRTIKTRIVKILTNV
jgi:hypothetical protein